MLPINQITEDHPAFHLPIQNLRYLLRQELLLEVVYQRSHQKLRPSVDAEERPVLGSSIRQRLDYPFDIRYQRYVPMLQ